MKPSSRFVFVLLFLALVAIQCQQQKPFDPSSLRLSWQLVANNFDGQGHFLTTLTIQNTSDSPIPASGWKIFFNLRYHSINLESRDSALRIERINGELFAIIPTLSMKPVAPGRSLTLPFSGERMIANFQDVPSGFFWVSDDSVHSATPLDPPIVVTDGEGESLLTTDATKFSENARIQDIPESELTKILPTPISYRPLPGTFTIDAQTLVVVDSSLSQVGRYLQAEVKRLTGFDLPVANLKNGKEGSQISIVRTTGVPEKYTLSVSPKGCKIEASDEAGAFYAIQSLKQLLPPDSWAKKHATLTLPAVEVVDQPRFPYRAFMLDVARNFESKENVLRLLEVMALYKLNAFHFHFNDDEGWRLEIPGLPELTDVGAARGYPFAGNERLQPAYGSGPSEQNRFGTGYYTRADFIEILKFATERHIAVIPEIESPGHARAAIRSMESRYNRLMREGNMDEATRYLLHNFDDTSKYVGAQYFNDNVMDAAMPSTYTFIDHVIGEIQKMYHDAGAPLTMIHMGGDEVAAGAWDGSPTIQELKRKVPTLKTSADIYEYFFDQVTPMFDRYHIKMTGWEEMVMRHLPDGKRQPITNIKYQQQALQFDAWWDISGGEDAAYTMANAGYGTVLTCFDYFYFDLAQAPSFREPGDAWIGYLPLKKTFSFVPFGMHQVFDLDMQLRPIDPHRYDHKPTLSALGRRNIRGLQAALWAENMTFDGYMEYQVLPRLLALSERAWSPDPTWTGRSGEARTEAFDQDWSSFANRVGKRELPRLDHYFGGYKYRIPNPSYQRTGGKLEVNAELPGFAIHYTVDGTEPTKSSEVYTHPIEAHGGFRLRAFDTTGRGGATVIVE